MNRRVFTSVAFSCVVMFSLSVRAEEPQVRGQKPEAGGHSEAKPPQATSPKPQADLLTGVIDPFQPWSERVRFLAASRPDNELEKAEFEADQKKINGLIRSFESWKAAIAFDADKNGTLSWFEVMEYRDSLRRVVLERFDANRNKTLKDKEREQAIAFISSQAIVLRPLQREKPIDLNERMNEIVNDNTTPLQRSEALLQEKLTKLEKAEKAGVSGARLDVLRRDIASLNAVMDSERRKLAEQDIDGDGRVSPEEFRASKQKKVDEALVEHLAKNDLNKNGVIDAAEYDRYKAERDGEFKLMFDSNRDGALDDAEKAKWHSSTVYKHWLSFDAADKDKNGILFVEEQDLYFELVMKEHFGNDANKPRVTRQP